MMRYITHAEVEDAARKTAYAIRAAFPPGTHPYTAINIYPIPRGGVAAAYMVKTRMDGINLVATPDDADCFLDDLIDSGNTRAAYAAQYPGAPFFTLFNRADFDDWLVFPWEGDVANSATDIPVRLLQFIGEDPKRGGLIETPQRFLKAWGHWSSGYKQAPAEVLKVFEDGAEKCDELVLVKNIPVYSHCEHHLAPFFGVAHVGYIPNGKIVGLSKLSRLVDIYARRLQVQERLTNQIADALEEHLQPLGVGVVIECRHLCMESRGVARQGSHTTTSAMRGALRIKPEARAEFMSLIK
jgi:GTP cyclohydrolase I